jgi:hypothetical protein
MHWKGLHLACIPILYPERFSTDHDCESMATVRVPGKRFTGLQNMPPDDQVGSLGDGF